MFSSKPKDTVTPAPTAALATTSAHRRTNGRPGSAPSIISADLVVQGNLISGGDIHIDGRVEGDVLHEAFAVEAGAFFEGSCRHSSNPLGDEAPKPQAVAKSDAPQPAPPFMAALVAQGT